MISLNQKLAGTHKELIVLNIFKYKYCVNFARYRKLLTNWWPV